MSRLLLTAGIILPAACGTAPKDTPPAVVDDPTPRDGGGTLRHRAVAAPSVADPHSLANPQQVQVHHVDLDVRIHWDEYVLKNIATLALARHDPTAPLVVDTGKMWVRGVKGSDGSSRKWSRGEEVPNLGRALTIELAPEDTSVDIVYETYPEAEALQWLAPDQTRSGKQPFLYSQGQAILTRSWIPLQDSPGCRVTWTAEVRGEGEVVMSADRRSEAGDGAIVFEMTKPVPPYLIAIAAGELERREVSDRVAVWAEPAVVDAATAEFADTEQMIQECEATFGAYRWGRYDILVLPPAFPFGGMENPCLTFATPTILAGDKSLVALIAHELAHSWSGNLVTNATWRDFWLNEGFTVYLEHRIVELVYGDARRRMETLIGLRGLRAEVAELPEADQVLHIDLTGRNPDDGMTSIPYDKGAAFLRRLEEVFGRERFDPFLQSWFDAHAFQSVTTADFLAWLDEELLQRHPELAAQVDVPNWVTQPGLPATLPVPQSEAFAQVDAVRTRWLGGAPAAELSTRDWNTWQWHHFLTGLPESLLAARMAELDEAFDFTRTGNSEILAVWLQRAVRHGYEPAMARLNLFLLTVGRRKFLTPLYRELLEADGNNQRALGIYRRARPRYHAVARRTLDELLGWKPKGE